MTHFEIFKKSEDVFDGTVLKKPLKVQGFPSLELNRNIVLWKGESKKDLTVLNMNVPSTFQIEQPQDLINKKTFIPTYEIVVGYWLSEDKKQVYIMTGNPDRGNHLFPYSIANQRVKGMALCAYKIYVYRYDKEKNLCFWAVQFQTDKQNTLFIPCDWIDIKEFMDKMKMYGDDQTKTRALREIIYRHYTSNKSNGHKGYIKTGDIPYNAKGSLRTLTNIVKHLNIYGTNTLGENTFSIFLSWLTYHHMEKCSGDLSKELLYLDRDNFMKIFNKIWKHLFTS